MFLTAQITEGAVKLPDADMLAEAARKVTIPEMSIILMFVAMGIFAVIFVLACYFAYKYRGNAGGALMAFILGFVAAIVGSSGGSVFSLIFRVDNLKASDKTAVCILGCALTGLLGAAVEFGLRYYLMWYMEKTGVGKHKGISVACGYVGGTVGPYVLQMLSSALAGLAINKGTYFTETAYGNADVLQSYITSRNDLASIPVIQYYALIFTILSFCALHVFLTMYMTRGWLEDRKLKNSLVAAGVTALAAIILQSFNGLVMGNNPITDRNGALIINLVYDVIVIGLAAYFTYKTLQNFPHGREKVMKSASKLQAEAEERKKRSTWAQVNAINARNIVAETEPESDGQEPESEAETEEKKDVSDN